VHTAAFGGVWLRMVVPPVDEWPDNCTPWGDTSALSLTIFHVARYLKGKHSDTRAHDFLGCLQAWFEYYDLGAEHEFEDVFTEFLYSFDRVKYVPGDVLRAVLAQRKKFEFPEWIYHHKLGPRNGAVSVLMETCFLLAERSQPEPFFLDVRTAGLIVGKSHTIAAKMLANLCSNEFLRLEEKGARGKASVYSVGKGRGFT